MRFRLPAWLPSPLFVASVSGVVLGLVFTSRFLAPPNAPPPTMPPSGFQPTISKAAMPDQTLLSPPDIGLLTAAPLFSPTRLPIRNNAATEAPIPSLDPIQKTETTDPGPPPPALHFLGIMAADKKRLALVRNLDTGAERWLAHGEEYDNWALIEIEADHLRFALDDNEFTVKLKD